MNTLLFIVTFLLLLVYLRFSARHAIGAFADEKYIYGIYSMCVSIAALIGIALVFKLSYLMSLATFVILSPVIAYIVYDDDRFF